MGKTKKTTTMRKVFTNPYYKGKHIIIISGQVFTARTGQKAARILKTVRKKYPRQTPQVTYIPKNEALIL